jgi:hypothetical protein
MNGVVPMADAIDVGVKVISVWISSAAVGAMLGGFAAVAQKKPRETRQDWAELGGAMGCAFGFLLMVCAVAALTR